MVMSKRQGAAVAVLTLAAFLSTLPTARSGPPTSLPTIEGRATWMADLANLVADARETGTTIEQAPKLAEARRQLEANLHRPDYPELLTVRNLLAQVYILESRTLIVRADTTPGPEREKLRKEARELLNRAEKVSREAIERYQPPIGFPKF
jgi:hypothetical protein